MAVETTLRRMQADRKEPRGKTGFDEADVAQGKHQQAGKPLGPNEINVTKLAWVPSPQHAVWGSKSKIKWIGEQEKQPLYKQNTFRT